MRRFCYDIKFDIKIIWYEKFLDVNFLVRGILVHIRRILYVEGFV